MMMVHLLYHIGGLQLPFSFLPPCFSTLREGYATTLEGFQVGRDWVVYTDSLEKFLDTPRKPGPKGPRKKQLEPEHSATTSKKNETDNS
jgi:hypothetical protein